MLLFFISTNPHLVVSDENWITTRFLFVECLKDPSEPNDENSESNDDDLSSTTNSSIIQPGNYIRHFNPQYPQYNYPPFAYPNPIVQHSNRTDNSNFILLDTQYYPVWLNSQPLQIPKRDYSIINNEIPDGSSIGIDQFVYVPSDEIEIVKESAGSMSYNSNGSMLYDVNEDTLDYEDEDSDEEIEYYDDENFQFSEAEKKKEVIDLTCEYTYLSINILLTYYVLTMFLIYLVDEFDPTLLPLPGKI